MDDAMPQAGVPKSLFLFLGTWSLMMVAMMLPSILPMVMTYTGAVRLHDSAIHAYARTTVFVLGYLALWSAVGLVFYAANTWSATIQSILSSLGVSGSIATGALLILAGVYQLTPLKDRCLTGCRTPLGFIASRWHDGLSGGFRMGLEHGLYCLGCCGAMLAVFIAFGLMNLPVMVLLTLWILAEKLLPFGSQMTRPAAAGFMASGILFILFPS
jgi:predicted metal-binding membrane protein